VFSERYANEPFVDVLPVGQTPETGHVKGGNRCQIGVTVPQERDTAVVTVAIDNLVKGASGQAVQVMNLMFGLPETCGLDGIAISP
jgi:N-acetyl-gamma-glutamyl-phosphate reductase